MYKFLIVIEKLRNNYSAYAPDLPGCVATGKTKKITEKNMSEAIRMHLEGLAEEHRPIPRAKAISEYVVVKEKI